MSAGNEDNTYRGLIEAIGIANRLTKVEVEVSVLKEGQSQITTAVQELRLAIATAISDLREDFDQQGATLNELRVVIAKYIGIGVGALFVLQLALVVALKYVP